MEVFAKIDFQPLYYFRKKVHFRCWKDFEFAFVAGNNLLVTKSSILDVWPCFKFAFVAINRICKKIIFDVWQGTPLQFTLQHPANTPTWKRPFPHRFDVEYTWCVWREALHFYLFEVIAIWLIRLLKKFAEHIPPYIK